MSGTEARLVIAQELGTHRLERCTTSSAIESIQWWQCSGCGFKSCTFPIKGMQWEVLQQEIAADHLAVQIDRTLGVLTRETVTLNEYAAANGEPAQRQSRWVSSWTAS